VSDYDKSLHRHDKNRRWSHGKQRLKRCVFRRLRKTGSEGADVTCGGRPFQMRAAATGKARSPTVDNRVRRTTSDDDEADRRRRRASKLRVCGTGWSVLLDCGRKGTVLGSTLYVNINIFMYLSYLPYIFYKPKLVFLNTSIR